MTVGRSPDFRLLAREKAKKKAEPGHNESEGHDSETGAHPRKERPLGSEENTRIVH